MSTLTDRIPIRPRILIAEDDPFLIKILKQFMEDEMLEVDMAKDGQMAINLLHKNKYRLALLDVNMPLKNGFDVLREISAVKDPPSTIMFSNIDSPESKDEALALGAKEYFVKHKIDINDLRKIVQTYILEATHPTAVLAPVAKPKTHYPISER